MEGQWRGNGGRMEGRRRYQREGKVRVMGRCLATGKCDGVPQNTVYAITQTHDGYLWVGTAGGLVRFDGVQFRSIVGCKMAWRPA
jgi:hypothetical protein